MNPENPFTKLIEQMEKFADKVIQCQKVASEAGKSFWHGHSQSGRRKWIPGWWKAEEAAFNAGRADAFAEVIEWMNED